MASTQRTLRNSFISETDQQTRANLHPHSDGTTKRTYALNPPPKQGRKGHRVPCQSAILMQFPNLHIYGSLPLKASAHPRCRQCTTYWLPPLRTGLFNLIIPGLCASRSIRLHQATAPGSFISVSNRQLMFQLVRPHDVIRTRSQYRSCSGSYAEGGKSVDLLPLHERAPVNHKLHPLIHFYDVSRVLLQRGHGPS